MRKLIFKDNVESLNPNLILAFQKSVIQDGGSNIADVEVKNLNIA